jgi:hypothetical protein
VAVSDEVTVVRDELGEGGKGLFGPLFLDKADWGRGMSGKEGVEGGLAIISHFFPSFLFSRSTSSGQGRKRGTGKREAHLSERSSQQPQY